MATAPFSRFEWMIAWRYLRARRAEGGVSVMTWISLIGITLAVAALIITLAVRSGFRQEFVDTILGANAHMTVYSAVYTDANGTTSRAIEDYQAMAGRLRDVPGVTRAAPLITGQVMANLRSRNAGVEVYGITLDDLKSVPRVAQPLAAQGDIDGFGPGIAIGMDLALDLGAQVGDRIRLISPNGVKTALGTSPRVAAFEVAYIFRTGRYQIDKARIYLPFEAAQEFFNREGAADEIEVMVEDPERVEDMAPSLLKAAGDGMLLWSWKDASGDYLDALAIEDTVMFVLMAILVLIASLNIVSGLVMLVKNKGRDIGILRTMGLTEGSILRVFFICGALVGIIGTAMGVILGCLFALYFDPILAFINDASGGGAWQPSIRGIYRLPADLRFEDVAKAVSLSLVLAFGVTIFPARRAARMNPVEALRYE